MLMVLLVIVAVGLPYYFSSQKATALDAKTKTARDEEKGFRETSQLGEKVRKQSDDWKKSLDTLQAAMPANQDVQGAIRTLQALTDNDISPDSVRWISGAISGIATKAPTPVPVETTIPAKGKTSTTVVAAADPKVLPPPASSGFDLSISVEGSRAKVLAFVSKIQQKPDALPRLFSVKSVTLAPGVVSAAAPAGASTPTTAPTTDANVMVKAEIKLKVTGFGSPTTAGTASTASASPIPAGPATSVASSPATSAPTP